MKRTFFSLVVVIVLALTACASRAGVGTTQPSTSDQVTNIVAATLQALPSSTPAIPDELLPHTLYYLGRDVNTGLMQVFRMERDGKRVTQLTFETVNITDYDVSPLDGSIAYVANNQLTRANADGSNRRVLVDGMPREENNYWLTNPVYSPDGKRLGYGYKGLNLYDIAAGVSQLVIEDQTSAEILPNGLPFPLETYKPELFSPDGTKLLLALGHWETLPSHAVYYPDTKALIHYEEVTDYIYCCSFHGGPVWSPDSSSFYGVASIHDTSYQSGELWKIDAITGSVTRMLRSEDGMLNLPRELFLAPDGLLYFFLGSYHVDSGFWDAPTLKMVCSAPDDITEPTVLRDENFVLMKEALWAPDASFVIVATAPSRDWNQGGGVLELYYTDAQKSAVWLAPFGQQLKWGP